MDKKYNSRGNWTVSTSECYSGSFVKSGGSLIYSTGSTVRRIVERGSDPWGYGRWTYVRYQGKAGKSLLLIGAYRVGRRTSNPGPTTAWFQQKVLLSKDGREITPEDAFIKDMETWLIAQKLDTTEVFMALDTNEQWKKQSSIQEFANRLQLLNLNKDGGYEFPASHPCITNPARDTTIDYILCTPNILENISYATMAPYDLQTLGDHRFFGRYRHI